MQYRYLLPRSTPEALGIPSSAILSFLSEADETIHDLHSFMLLRHGTVAAEGWWAPYSPHQPHMLFSLSKSFTSTAVGLAVAEGRLSVDDPVINYFPEDAPTKPSRKLAAMRVRHLLSMSTGHAEDITDFMRKRRDGNWARAFLSRPVKYEPGTHFFYNSGATYMLSAIVQKLAGLTLLDYLRPRLFEPLGITNPIWASCPRGINVGGWGLSIKTEDIARFGQLYLQNGVWDGKQVIPAAWVAEAIAKQVSNGSNPNIDWKQGYGYQFWRCQHRAYRGDGAFGQFCIVMPEKDAVLAITSGVGDMQAVLDLVWKHLLPAMGPEALPADATVEAELAAKLASLSIPLPVGESYSPRAKQLSGMKYVFEKNAAEMKWISFNFPGDGCVLTVADARGEHRLHAGGAVWMHDTTTLEFGQPSLVAVAGSWVTKDFYTLKLCFTEKPFCPELECHFNGDRLTLNYKMNVSFVPSKRQLLVGKVIG